MKSGGISEVSPFTHKTNICRKTDAGWRGHDQSEGRARIFEYLQVLPHLRLELGPGLNGVLKYVQVLLHIRLQNFSANQIQRGVHSIEPFAMSI